MTINITIETETISEFYSHISVIGKEIKKAAKKQKLNPLRDEFTEQEWEDDNCYGTHTVQIKP